ncbi:hypothetical protein DERF_012055 [Dermatophagoides farinae]|uniref:Uncharacterized protein n=1 Tax=Dermatophagoides farinae TaxID=6954 RepID=A0A922HNW5_DERFA|nr:hypothetical protein DERF_012055 [Dermatophagoides farinae]
MEVFNVRVLIDDDGQDDDDEDDDFAASQPGEAKMMMMMSEIKIYIHTDDHYRLAGTSSIHDHGDDEQNQ